MDIKILEKIVEQTKLKISVVTANASNLENV